tara:strand:+ start:872 stop:1585 length:714 start_codon:yes stop_codon:yes gene_type:complete
MESFLSLSLEICFSTQASTLLTPRSHPSLPSLPFLSFPSSLSLSLFLSFFTHAQGFNAWNAFHCSVSERLLMQTADALVETGLAKLGFTHINLDVRHQHPTHLRSLSLSPPTLLDLLNPPGPPTVIMLYAPLLLFLLLNFCPQDCWMVERNASDGTIGVDPVRFPSGMKALANYIHSKGLSFGIYTAPASTTPQGRPGLFQHEAIDVKTFCEWGVDYLKLDSKGELNLNYCLFYVMV